MRLDLIAAHANQPKLRRQMTFTRVLPLSNANLYKAWNESSVELEKRTAEHLLRSNIPDQELNISI